MSNIKGVLREGWQPKGKDGGRESWRGDFKGVNQVAGWVGKGKNSTGRASSAGVSDHISRPLATLKDPAAFGPPPKNVNFHGGAALPNQTTPDRRGLGVPLSDTQIHAAERAVHNAEEDEVAQPAKPAGPPVPFRADRTGLRANTLPPPPLHRAIGGGGNGSSQQTGVTPGPPKAKPNLPPRLPPRSNSSSLSSPTTATIDSPPPAYESVSNEPKSTSNTYLNQTAVNRLGNAGISVPGLGIGKSSKSTSTDRSQSTSSPPSQLNELQSRFSRMSSNASSGQSITTTTTPLPYALPTTQTPPTQGTSLAQKQAAMQTAQSFHKDPSSVSLSDAQAAASTANNFRERHQDQIAASAQRANSWNKKYNITSRMNSFLEQQATVPATDQKQQEIQETPVPTPDQTSGAGTIEPGSRRPPPPPPKKPSSMHAPPPVPLGTKPSFG